MRLKKIFYALHPLLACRWIEHTLSQPPTEFERLLQAEWVTDDERQMISQPQAAKALASEADRYPMPSELSAWLAEQMAYFEGIGPTLVVNASSESRELDRVLAESVAGSS